METKISLWDTDFISFTFWIYIQKRNCWSYGSSIFNILRSLQAVFHNGHTNVYWWWCSVAKSSLTLCGPVNCSKPGLPVLHYLPEFAETPVLVHVLKLLLKLKSVIPSNHLILYHLHWLCDYILTVHRISPPLYKSGTPNSALSITELTLPHLLLNLLLFLYSETLQFSPLLFHSANSCSYFSLSWEEFTLGGLSWLFISN